MMFDLRLALSIAVSVGFKAARFVPPDQSAFRLMAALQFVDAGVHLREGLYWSPVMLTGTDKKHLEAAALLSQCPAPQALVRHVASVFSHVMEIMLEDYLLRFDLRILENPHSRIVFYQTSARSPFLGSGFYESTMRSALDLIGARPPQVLDSVVKKMRKLRQIIDEIADVHEDIVVGRVTYPVLVSLADDSLRKLVIEQVRQVWAVSGSLICTANRNDMSTIATLRANRRVRLHVDRIYELLTASGAFQKVYEEAENLYLAIIDDLELLGAQERIGGIVQILALKRAFLERLKQQKWRDMPVPPVEIE